MLHCKLCDTKFSKRRHFTEHVGRFHKGLNIEPEIVLEDDRDLSTSEINEVSLQPSPYSMESNLSFSKPRKGMWIVKLERLSVNDLC